MIDIILGTVIVAFVLALFAAVMVMIIGDTETFRAIDEKIARVIICKDIDEQPTIELPKWIPCSERLPKENECVGNVWKYYLIQDEYEDMHVAHLSSRGWETIESFKALECDVVAWMPLPEPWKGADNE